MNKLRAAILLAALGIAALLVAPLYRWWTEPTYKGERVSVWFERFRKAPQIATASGIVNWFILDDGTRLSPDGKPMPDPGKEALLAIGEPAIRFLERRVAAGGFGVRGAYGRAYTNLPVEWRTRLPNPFERDQERVDAIIALAAFGTNAQASAPLVLARLPELSLPFLGVALKALPKLQPTPDQVDRLIETFARSQRFEEVKQVIERFRTRSPEAAKAVGLMLEAQGGSDLWPFMTLRNMDKRAAVAIPTLQKLLSSTKSEMRYQAVRTLETIGPSAASTLPDIERCLADESQMVQSAAKRSIAAITADPAKQL